MNWKLKALGSEPVTRKVDQVEDPKSYTFLWALPVHWSAVSEVFLQMVDKMNSQPGVKITAFEWGEATPEFLESVDVKYRRKVEDILVKNNYRVYVLRLVDWDEGASVVTLEGVVDVDPKCPVTTEEKKL